ncbi:MAG: N-acetylmuramoyl-L-alanine amidase family protein [Bacillota bacterium]
MAGLRILKKIHDLYLTLPLKVRFSFLIAIFIAISVFSIGFNEYRKSNGPDKKAYLTDNSLIDSGKTGKDAEEDNKEVNEEPKPKEVIIVIDPGHGGDDLGAYNGKLYEKDINLDISLRLGKLLSKEGIKVVYTREKDVFVDLDPRAKLANDLGATLFISVHSNSMPNNSDYRGTETLYCPPANSENSKMDGRKLAIIVQNELIKALKTVDNGIIYRPNLLVLRKTQMPAVIAEIAYISNPSDRAKLTSSEFKQKAANALSSAVMKALDRMEAKKDENGVWKVIQK